MKLKYFLILLTVTISCKTEKKELIKFDSTTLIERDISLTEIADDISYIPLDNSTPIGPIYDNIKFLNNSIYLSAQNTGVLEFNMQGQFIRKIGKFGRGPGEYTHCYSFTIDDKSGTVYVRDGGGIMKAFSKSGVYLRSFSLQEYGDMIDEIEFFNSNLFTSYSIQYENANYEWIIFDTLGRVLDKKERTTPKFVSNALGGGGIYRFDNTLTYWNNYTDTAFLIFPDLKQKPSFIISSGEQRLPKSKITVETMSDYMWFQQIFETNHFIFIRYFFPLKKYPFVLIDKHINKSYLINLNSDDGGSTLIGGILNDLDGGTRFLPQSYFTKNSREFVVGLIYPYQIQAHVKSAEFKNATAKYSEMKENLIKLAGSLKETDNPILMIVRLKK
jgi:hypothetical protein